MGVTFSKNKNSRDGEWVSVAIWDEEIQWDKIDETLFDGIDAREMRQLTLIMALKRNYQNGEYWDVDKSTLRLSNLTWHNRSRQISYNGVSKIHKPSRGYFWTPIEGEANFMEKIAIHKGALEDFKINKSNGAIFMEISLQQREVREEPVKMATSNRRPFGFAMLKHFANPGYKMNYAPKKHTKFFRTPSPEQQNLNNNFKEPSRI